MSKLDQKWTQEILLEWQKLQADETVLHNQDLHKRIVETWKQTSPIFWRRLQVEGLGAKLAFVLQHPAVTSPIIGPRTMEQFDTQVGAVDVRLSTDVLDRIDRIVEPGVTLSFSDEGYVLPALEDPFLRRRRTA